jgi:hypothetical protein
LRKTTAVFDGSIGFDRGDLETRTGFALSFAPNPFRHSSAITLGPLRGGERIHLAVYNALGQRVRTLVEGSAEPHMARIDWDGRKDDGGRVAPGTYFLRVTVDGRSETKKVTLIR